MKIVLSALMGLALIAGAASAQDGPVQTAPRVLTTPPPPPPVAVGPRGEPLTGVPLLVGAIASPTCGDVPLSAPIACVTTPLGQMATAATAYIDHYKAEGWLAVDGDDDRIVMIRRRPSGGCDAIQMIAFNDPTKPDVAASPGYLGFATIPGDICAASSVPALGASAGR